DDREVVGRVGLRRRELQRLAEAALGLVQAPEALQRDAAVAEALRGTRVRAGDAREVAERALGIGAADARGAGARLELGDARLQRRELLARAREHLRLRVVLLARDEVHAREGAREQAAHVALEILRRVRRRELGEACGEFAQAFFVHLDSRW